MSRDPKHSMGIAMVPFDPAARERVGCKVKLLTMRADKIGEFVITGRHDTKRVSITFTPTEEYKVIKSNMILIVPKGEE